METSAPPPLPYSYLDSARAHADWGANCGPHSLAAALGISLDAVLALMPEFEALPRKRRYTNPTMMERALVRSGRKYTSLSGLKTHQLCEGINRIQWVGDWLAPGKPVALAYCFTHWVAYQDGFVLCTGCDPDTWLKMDDWKSCLAGENRPWYVTHHYYL